MISRRTVLKTSAAGLLTVALPQLVRSEDQQAHWEDGPDLPIPLQEIYATVHRGEIWVAGGLTVTGTGDIAVSDRCFVLNPDTRVWREGPRLSEPMHHPQMVSVAGTLYLIGGFRVSEGGAWAMRDTVEMLNGDGWQTAAPLPMPLAETHAAVLNGKVHLAGGRTPVGQSNADWQDHADTDVHLIFDPADESWREGPPLPFARNSGAAVSEASSFYVLGGRTVAGGNRADVHRFDVATGGWTALANLPEARGGTAAALLDERIFLFGGEYFDGGGNGGVYETVLAYTISDDDWVDLGPIPTPRHGLASVARNGRIWTLGGATEAGANGTSRSVEILSPLFSLQLGRI